MIKIYYSCFKDRLNENRFSAYLNSLPPALIDKILKFKRWQDAHASLYGKLLLKLGIQELGLSATLNDLLYSKYGRPHLDGSIDFNITHSGQYVVCAFAAQSQIGVDLEQVREIETVDFENQFSPAEWNTIDNATHTAYAFFYYWTIKEAIIKAEGSGLSIPLKDIIIKEDTAHLNDKTWFYKNIPFQDNYILHIASNKMFKHDIVIREIFF